MRGERPMNCPEIRYSEESGFVLVTAMLLLVVLTVIGIAATQTSIFEILLASAERKKQEAFYSAEGGLEHGSVLVAPMMDANIDPDDQSPKLTFLLDGSQQGLDAATGTEFEEGAVLLGDQTIGDGYTYSVRLYNNKDGGGPTQDMDGLVILGSRAQKANGGASQLEIGLRTFVTFQVDEDYRAQEGAGGTKNYNANDAGVVEFRTGNNANQAEGQYQLGV